VALITGIAVYGMATQAHRPALVLAAVLGLPFGVVSLVGLYVLTGLFNAFSNGFSNSSTTYSSGGCDAAGHCWSRTWGSPVGARGFLFSACVVLLFTGAALGNVLLVRRVGRRTNRGTPAAPPWPVPQVPTSPGGAAS